MAVLVGLLSLGAYLTTIAPSITWKNGGIDSGELALAVSRTGVAHPTGYPLYVLLGSLFAWLPWGDLAFRLNLFSAVCAAAAAAVLTLAVEMACPDDVPGWERYLAGGVAGLMLAFSPALWSQAVITEVYGLHGLFVAGMLAILVAVLRSRDEGRQRRLLALGCLTAGLSLAHHVTSALLAPGVLLALWLVRKHLPPLTLRDVATGLSLVLLGTSPYLLLPVRAAQQAVANWGDPQTLANFVAHVSASAYGRLADSPSLAALTRVPAAARLLLDQFGWPGFLLAVTGCWVLWQRDRPLAGFLALSSFLVVAQAIHYRGRDSEVYLLPLYILLAFALGVGAAAIVNALPALFPTPRRAQRRSGSRRHLPRLALGGGAVMLALLPVASFFLHRDAVDLQDDHEATEYAREVLDTLGPGAVILTQEDQETFSLWYAHYVLGVRPDVLILDARLLRWPWYRDNLRRLRPDLAWPDGSGIAVEQVLDVTRTRPFYFTYADPSYRTTPQGRVFALDRTSVGEITAPSSSSAGR